MSAETLDDGFERFDFSQRNGGIGHGVEQVPQEDGALLFREFFKRRVGLRTGGAHVSVKPADNFGRTGVKFGAFAETIEAGIGQVIGCGGESGFVQAEIIGEEIVERFLAGIISGVFKDFGAELLGETNDLEEMAVAVAGQSGDAHAGENFSQAGIDGRAGFFHAARFEGFRKLVRKIGHDSAGASGHEQGYMMRVEDLRRFDNQRHIPQAFANHGFPHRGGREKCGKWRAIGTDCAIGKEEEPRAPATAQRGSR